LGGSVPGQEWKNAYKVTFRIQEWKNAYKVTFRIQEWKNAYKVTFRIQGALIDPGQVRSAAGTYVLQKHPGQEPRVGFSAHGLTTHEEGGFPPYHPTSPAPAPSRQNGGVMGGQIDRERAIQTELL